MAKIYRVIHIKLNRLVYENVHTHILSLTYQQSVFKRCHSDKHLPVFHLYNMAMKINWYKLLDMGQNCVTVTLCILAASMQCDTTSALQGRS